MPTDEKVSVLADDYLLSEDVATILGISRSTVHEWLGRGLIPHRKPPNTRRCFIPKRDFELWLNAGAELETIPLAGGGRIVRPIAKKRAA